MTDRELMQQALEALESDNPDIQLRAAIALRERLAQPQMQPCAGRNCGSIDPNLHSAECFEEYEKATGMNQRKPLTDEQIEELCWTELDRRLLSFARAIEAAHGIGEKRDRSANQYEHPLVVSQTRTEHGMRYIGPLTGRSLDAAVDSARSNT